MNTPSIFESQLKESLLMSNVPMHIHGGIIRYIVSGIRPGDFLSAVICNDLRESFGRADEENRDALFYIVEWFYNHAPAPCWGSDEKMYQWTVAREIECGVRQERKA